MESLTIRNLQLGSKKAKICVPITGSSQSQIVEMAKAIANTPADLVEWRCDYYAQCKNISMVIETLKLLVEHLAGKPLIFTFRTRAEGGEQDISIPEYLLLYKAVMLSKKVDLIDVELFRDDATITNIIKHARVANIYVIMSHHDFSSTPPKDKIVKRLLRMKQKGADICKGAYMPRSEADVDTMFAAAKMAQMDDLLFVLISMGELGIASRIEATKWGSCMTFASWQIASAPGQIGIAELYQKLH